MEVCILYRILVYIVKKGINIFSKKVFLRGGHNVAPRGGAKNVPSPYTNALLRPCFDFAFGILLYVALVHV